MTGNGTKNGRTLWTVVIVAGWFITGMITWSLGVSTSASTLQEQVIQNRQDIALNRQEIQSMCEDIQEIKGDVKILVRRGP